MRYGQMEDYMHALAVILDMLADQEAILLGYAKYRGMFGILVRIRDKYTQTLRALTSSDDAKARHIARTRE